MMSTVGGVLNVLGVILAGVGLSQTWRAFAPPDATFWQPVARPIGTAWRALSANVRRLLRRPRHATVHVGGAAVGVTFSVTGRARVAYGPPPDPTVNLAGFAEVMHTRINAVHEQVQVVAEQLADEATAREKADREVTSALHAEVESVRTFARDVALDGVRLEALGLGFVALGSTLSLLG